MAGSMAVRRQTWCWLHLHQPKEVNCVTRDVSSVSETLEPVPTVTPFFQQDHTYSTRSHILIVPPPLGVIFIQTTIQGKCLFPLSHLVGLQGGLLKHKKGCSLRNRVPEAALIPHTPVKMPMLCEEGAAEPQHRPGGEGRGGQAGQALYSHHPLGGVCFRGSNRDTFSGKREPSQKSQHGTTVLSPPILIPPPQPHLHSST